MNKFNLVITIGMSFFMFGCGQSLSAKTESVPEIGSQYEFNVIDINDEDVYINYLVFDDSVFVILDIADILADNYNHYKINLPEGSHNIKASYEDYSLIDTTIIFTSNVRQIELIVDMKNAVHLSEFKDGFNKIYTNKNYEPIIGLREDGSFLLKSFFHISIVGCFQFESGKYKIEENKLILDVDNYRSRCFRSAQKIEHTYEYTIENDSIVDLNKYSGFIEKKYVRGGGQIIKEIP